MYNDLQLAVLLMDYLNLNGNQDQEKAILTQLTLIQQQVPRNLKGFLTEILSKFELYYAPRRGLIITLLGKLGFQDATEKLKEILMKKSEDRYVRGAAAETLGQLHRNDAIPLLLEHALNEDEEIRVRSASIIALGWLHDEKVFPILLKLIDHPKSEIWLSASDALLNFEQESITQEIIQKFLKFQENSEGLKRSRFRDLLLQRNLVPLLPNASIYERKILQKLIIEQGSLNIPYLEFLRENTTNKSLLKLIGKILEKIQPRSLRKIRL